MNIKKRYEELTSEYEDLKREIKSVKREIYPIGSRWRLDLYGRTTIECVVVGYGIDEEWEVKVQNVKTGKSRNVHLHPARGPFHEPVV